MKGTDTIRLPKRPVEKEFTFTDNDFNYLSQLAYEYAGINITSAKRELMYGRIAKRLRQLGLTRFSQYCDLLKM